MENCAKNTSFLDLGKLKKSDTFNGFTFQLLEDDNTTPIDLTGAGFLMQLKTTEKSPVLYEFSTTKGNIQIIGDDIIVATVLDGLKLNPNVYIFDMLFTNLAGVKQTIFNGKIEIVW